MTREAVIAAVRTVERGADALMRLGDTQNAISLYSVALQLRAEHAEWREETFEDAIS